MLEFINWNDLIKSVREKDKILPTEINDITFCYDNGRVLIKCNNNVIFEKLNCENDFQITINKVE
jgi:hypothetical protein